MVCVCFLSCDWFIGWSASVRTGQSIYCSFGFITLVEKDSKKKRKKYFPCSLRTGFLVGDKAERKAELKLDMRGMS